MISYMTMTLFLSPNPSQLSEGDHNTREMFFLMRADLCIFFWANKSQGVKSLIDWYLENGKDVCVCTL
ncbi:hypothetical protein PAPYR_7894 [Paratrimastix pyriformis]|uniref:Uncharacterized protein n=1 Tax=Paratrimastix pyriformis TaxID=342808 RepID=A0ABQ8UF77_9EUKA|nr:hypothetical protein PAPYR_7894 [Paratrimastix pyriformis]